MPQRKSSEPPEVMTWGRAAPALFVAATFDALGFMFEWFIFFGPALTGLYCATKVGDVWLIGGLLTKGCAAGAIAVATAASTALIGFGEIMAIAIGLAGWLAVGLILIIFNRRIFKENALWFVGSLLLTEIPFVGSLPFVSVILWRMYSNQIRMEEAALKKWKKENAAAELQQRNQQTAQIMQIRAMQQQQREAGEERYEKERIPEEWREAA